MSELDKHIKIAEFNVGSLLYGTNGPNSDIDIAGIFIENSDYMFSPFKNIEEISENTISKQENGKNDKNAIDKKYYALQKFIKLAYDNNPNMIEMLYINDENILFDSTEYKSLRRNAHLFINKNIVKKFYAYAISQENRMYQTANKILNYQKFYDMIKEHDLSDQLLLHAKKLLNNFNKRLVYNSLGQPDYYFEIAEGYTLPFSLTIKEAKNRLEEKLDKASYRKNYILDKAYDYKFASHVVRLLHEGYEGIVDKKITFPLKNASEIKAIKNGEVDIEDLKLIIEKYKTQYMYAEIYNDLPEYGKHINDIENALKHMYKRHI